MLSAARCDSLHSARLCRLAPYVVIRCLHAHSAMRVAGISSVDPCALLTKTKRGTTDDDEYVREGSDWRPSCIERRRVSFPRSRNPSRIAPLEGRISPDSAPP
jgi:hypothetical protein